MDDVTESEMVVEGFTVLIMGKLNPRCYSDSIDEFSGCQVAKD